MRQAGYSVTVLAATVLFFGCATGRNRAPSTPEKATAVELDESGTGDPAPVATGLSQALSRAIDDRSEWSSLHLFVECAGDAGMRSAEVYGNGVGIWDYRQQFTLTPVEISSLLRALQEADFARFANIYGGRVQPDPRPTEEGAGSAIQVICRVVLSLAGERKQVAQRAKGEQSTELKQLAEELLAICETPGEAGTAATDLTDGLEKVSRGDLAPETFHLLLHHRPEKAHGETGGGGFLLRLSGPRVTSRGYNLAAGLLGPPLSLALTPTEVADLARELVSLNPAQLPLNLFGEDYTDLSVEVLDHKQSVQARRFAGMTPTTHGERQFDFALIYDALHRLHVRVQSEGAPAE